MNGLLLLAAVVIFCLIVYGPRLIGRKRKVIGKPYKLPSFFDPHPERDESHAATRYAMQDSETLREVNARRGQ